MSIIRKFEKPAVEQHKLLLYPIELGPIMLNTVWQLTIRPQVFQN